MISFSLTTLALALVLPQPAPILPRSGVLKACTAGVSAEPSKLQQILKKLAPLGPMRAICVMESRGAILEATTDSSAWAAIKETEMPSGAVLLTCASPDKSFEFHVDLRQAGVVTLGKSPKTGGPAVKILDMNSQSPLLTLLPNKAKVDEFDALVAEVGASVALEPSLAAADAASGASFM